MMACFFLFFFIQVLWLADRHSDQELYTAAKHCAKIHLAQLHQTEEFLNLPLCLLLDIVKGTCSNSPATLGTWNLCILDSLEATLHFETSLYTVPIVTENLEESLNLRIPLSRPGKVRGFFKITEN